MKIKSIAKTRKYLLSYFKDDPESPEDIQDLILRILRHDGYGTCLLYTSPSPRDRTRSRMPSSA